MIKKISVSAPGKLMLLGEHAVVYNHPCIVTAVDQRMRLTVERLHYSEFQLEAKDLSITGYKKPMSELGKGNIPKGAKFVEMAVKNTLELNSKFLLRHSGDSERSVEDSRISYRSNQRDSGQAVRRPELTAEWARMTVGMRVTTKSQFSPKLGFGSSSASTVCTIKGISELLSLNLPDREIFDLSYKTVLVIQGNGSGFDVGAAVYGGTLYFVTGGKTMEPLNISSLPLVVGYSGIKADTVTLMNKVKENFSNRQNRLEEIYNDIAKLVDKGKDALCKKDWEIFGRLINKNQDYLEQLEVSTQKLDAMIAAARKAGAYGAKLSGAGGGDCMIALVGDEKRQKVIEAIQNAGGEVIHIETNAEGVRTG